MAFLNHFKVHYLAKVNCKHFLFALLLISMSFAGTAQLSVATDVSILRNFNRQQKFWAFGQTVQANFHLNRKDAIYTWISYHTAGKFKNTFSATAKDPFVTVPPLVRYTSFSSLRYRHISVGWKRYLIGAYDSENMWNLYGYAGFGLLLGKATNTFSAAVDTASYKLNSPLPGEGNFKRLTFDAGLGAEFPLGTDIFLYTELRTWMPTTRYPSPYILNNHSVPAVAAVNLGIRIVVQ
jgi:hypothetical protein